MSETEGDFVEAESGKVVVNRVTIRTPPFCKDRPALWFASLEAQFSINGVVQQLTKFNYALAHLDTTCTREVEDIILTPPRVDPYDTLRNAIIHRFSVSQEEKVRCLLEKEQIGDRKSSLFYRYLKSLAGVSFPEDVLKTIWMSRLPRYLQTVLTAQRLQSLPELSELADQLMEINGQPSQHMGCASVASNSSLVNSDPQIAELNKKVEELTRVVASLAKLNNKQRGRSRERNYRDYRNRSLSRNKGLCFYHNRFNTKAKKCIQPCKWTGPPPSSAGNDGNNSEN